MCAVFTAVKTISTFVQSIRTAVKKAPTSVGTIFTLVRTIRTGVGVIPTLVRPSRTLVRRVRTDVETIRTFVGMTSTKVRAVRIFVEIVWINLGMIRTLVRRARTFVRMAPTRPSSPNRWIAGLGLLALFAAVLAALETAAARRGDACEGRARRTGSPGADRKSHRSTKASREVSCSS